MALAPIKFSHSELKTYERCPKQWQYKYEQELVPKKKSRPLYLGNWIHAALETHYRDGDWKIGHQEYVDNWNKLFDEEKINLRKPKRGKGGFLYPTIPPLPELVERIMLSYIWYNRDDGWEVVHTEFQVEVLIPIKNHAPLLFKGIVDLIIKDQEGLYWVVDHKTAGNIPDPTAFHAMDPQLMLYPWAIEKQLGIPIAGVIYNYVRSKPPTIPKLTKAGALSKRKVVSDYPTLRRFLRSSGFNLDDFAEVLRPLKRKSPFLRRYRLPREAHVTKEILRDAISVAKRIHSTSHFYRVITRDCQSMCSYHDLCRAELNGMDTTSMRKSMFTKKEDGALGRGDYADPGESDGEEEE